MHIYYVVIQQMYLSPFIVINLYIYLSLFKSIYLSIYESEVIHLDALENGMNCLNPPAFY